MTEQDAWDAIKAHNPAFAKDESETVTLTVRGLRKLFKAGFDTGWDQHQHIVAKFKFSGIEDSYGGLFKDIFKN